MSADITVTVAPETVITAVVAVGAPGVDGGIGVDGAPGLDGIDGASAYEIAQVYGGFVGTETEWLQSLIGAAGAPGLDGLTTSVNGITQVDGDITLTASDVGAAAEGAVESTGITMATGKLLGRGTAATGAIEEITLGAGLSLSGNTLNAAGGGQGQSYYDIGTKAVDFTVDVANGIIQKVTTSTANINMSLAAPPDTSKFWSLIVVAAQGTTARGITLKAADANVISSGGLLSSGDTLANSGNNSVDVLEFEFDPIYGKWEAMDARYDRKA